MNQALKRKLLECENRHDKIILQHLNTRPHVRVSIKNYLEMNWEIPSHLPTVFTR